MLSVVLKDAEQTEPVPEPEPQPEPAPASAPAPAPASDPKRHDAVPRTDAGKGGRIVDPPIDELLTELLVLHDLEMRITITFYTNRTFEVVLEHGNRERGTFRLEHDALVLDCGWTRLHISNDGSFTYFSEIYPEQSYQFIIEPEDLTTLKDAVS